MHATPDGTMEPAPAGPSLEPLQPPEPPSPRHERLFVFGPRVPGQLTEGWRWSFSVGWALLIPALMALGDAAHSLGKPPWWLDSNVTVTWLTPLPFLVLIGIALVGAANWRHWPWAGATGVVMLGVSALADRGPSPATALGEAVFGAAGLAITASAFAGRLRLPRN